MFRNSTSRIVRTIATIARSAQAPDTFSLTCANKSGVTELKRDVLKHQNQIEDLQNEIKEIRQQMNAQEQSNRRVKSFLISFAASLVTGAALNSYFRTGSAKKSLDQGFAKADKAIAGYDESRNENRVRLG